MTTVRVTSSAHAFVVTAYAFAVINGMFFQSGLAVSRGLTDLLTSPGYIVWASLMILSGVGCLVSSLLASRMANPSAALSVEFVSVVILAVCFGAYEWGLFIQSWDFAPTTQLLAICLALGGLARAIQIQFDLHRLRKALREIKG